MALDKKKIISNQYQKSKSNSYFLLTDGRSLSTAVGIDNQIELKVKDQAILKSTKNGTQLSKEIVNKGSVSREKNSLWQMEMPTKEFMIPSSMVTPLPDKFPWFAIFEIASNLVSTIMSLLPENK